MNQRTFTLHNFPDRCGTDWVERYLEEVLASKDASTLDAYGQLLVDF